MPGSSCSITRLTKPLKALFTIVNKQGGATNEVIGHDEKTTFNILIFVVKSYITCNFSAFLANLKYKELFLNMYVQSFIICIFNTYSINC
jgi:hypothetical protein